MVILRRSAKTNTAYKQIIHTPLNHKVTVKLKGIKESRKVYTPIFSIYSFLTNNKIFQKARKANFVLKTTDVLMLHKNIKYYPHLAFTNSESTTVYRISRSVELTFGRRGKSNSASNYIPSQNF